MSSSVEAPVMDDGGISRLDPQPSLVKLESGTLVEVLPLKMRQFFRLLRIVTHGAGTNLMSAANLNFEAGSEEFMQRFLALVLFSIPDAENEAISFIQSMVRPVGIKDVPVSQLTDADRKNNEALWLELNQEIYNPEIGDVLDIVEAIITGEAGDIQSLGRRVGKMIDLAKKTGQLKAGRPEETPEGPPDPVPAPSQSPSTSSPVSTDGPMNGSSGSPSHEPARSLIPSGDVPGMPISVSGA